MREKDFLGEDKQDRISELRPFRNVNQTASFLNISPGTKILVVNHPKVLALLTELPVPNRETLRCVQLGIGEKHGRSPCEQFLR